MLDTTNGAFTHQVPFDSATGFTFDGALIEFVGGVARLIGFAGLSDSTTTDFNLGTPTNMTVRSSPVRVETDAANIWTYPDNGASTWFDMSGNLVLLHMDDTGGTSLTDHSGNNRHLNCTSCPTLGEPGRFGTAINTSTGGATLSHEAALNAYPISFAFWIKYSNGTNKPIIEKRDGGGTGYRVFVESSRICLDYIINGSNLVNWFCPGATLNINDNQWHFVVAVVDASGGRIYQDATLAASGAWTGTPGPVTTTANLVVGNNWYWNNFNGVLDEMAVFNRALSASEILAIFQRQKYLYTGYYTSRIFDDGAPFGWNQFSWNSSFPAGKALPNGATGAPQSETVFTDGNADMTSNVFLFHADGTGPITNGSTRADSSGFNHTITANNADATGLAFVSDGQFGSAISFGDGDLVDVGQVGRRPRSSHAQG